MVFKAINDKSFIELKCRHLHFELYENGAVVDPQLEYYFGYMGGEGKLYVKTKRY